MRVFRGPVGEKGFASALAALVPLGTAAFAHAWVSSFAWADLWVAKRAWDWAFGGLSKSAAHSLNIAILVIGLPPVIFFVVLFFYVRSRSKSWRGDKRDDASSDLDAAPHADTPTRTRA